MKKLNKFFAVLVALAMMATLCVMSAFAADPDPAKPTTAKLVKYLEVPEGTAVPTVVNVFTFADNLAASSNVTAEELATANPGTQSITVNAQSPATVTTADANSVYQADTLKALGTFTHPGVYAYTVTETSSTITDGTANQAIVPGGESYIVRYVVKNVDGTPTVTDITVQQTNGAKVDATTTDPTTNDGTDTTEVEYDGFSFKNTYQKTETPDDPDNPAATAPLKVTKAIEGEGADATKSFPFNITLTKALGAPATALTGQVYNADGTADGAAITVNYGTPATFNLKGGQYFAIQNLPAGTRYEANELMANADTYSAWKPAVAVNTNEYAEAADLGQSLAAQATGETYLLEENDSDVIAYTNTYDKNIDTPTGILMNNLPYIVLALVAIGGLVAYVVVRRRQADEA